MQYQAENISVNRSRSVAGSWSLSNSTRPAAVLQCKKRKKGKKKKKGSPDPDIITKNGKRFMLIGTTHGRYGEDRSGEVPENMKKGAAIVLEYPSLAGTEQQAFTEGTIGSVNDKTQAALARMYDPEKNQTLIGADARKAFGDEGIHRLSLRHKDMSSDYIFKPKSIIPRSLLSSIADKYSSCCLGFSPEDPASLAGRLIEVIEYIDGTDLVHVMTATYNRMREIAATLPKDRRRSIKRKVMAKLERDMDKQINDYREKNEEYKANNYLPFLIRETNEGLISALYDSMANLLLYTEVLAVKKSKVIVAYGSDHLDPLRKLVNETWAKPGKKGRRKR